MNPEPQEFDSAKSLHLQFHIHILQAISSPLVDSVHPSITRKSLMIPQIEATQILGSKLRKWGISPSYVIKSLNRGCTWRIP